ncbi:hypothetical protein ABZ208_35455 [Streptomyces sp. NPDC006208]|uniref:hypothetical protein n=1 Tax=Streptomyces sp. NPDC006208 TaxID=3156734 RepID=UPI0033AA5872
MLPAAAADLRSIAVTWPLLTEALATPTTRTWPPAGRMADHLADLDQLDVPQRRARDGSGTGETPAPLSLHVLDTMQAVQAALVDCADLMARANQRSAIQPAPLNRRTRVDARVWSPADRVRRDRLAAADAVDPQRWRFHGHRTAVYAALWLCARVEGIRGPVTPFNEAQRLYVARVAAFSLERIEQALQLARVCRMLDEVCVCGEQLTISGGDGAAPAVRCPGCGRTVTAQLAA